MSVPDERRGQARPHKSDHTGNFTIAPQPKLCGTLAVPRYKADILRFTFFVLLHDLVQKVCNFVQIML
jgi:hypothetical protein